MHVATRRHSRCGSLWLRERDDGLCVRGNTFFLNVHSNPSLLSAFHFSDILMLAELVRSHPDGTEIQGGYFASYRV